MFIKIVNVSIIAFLFYIAFGVYTWLANRNAIKLFAEAFPKEYCRYYGNMSFNEKRLASFLFLWDKNIKNIIGSKYHVEKARRRARMCTIGFLVMMFSFPILFGVIAYMTYSF